MFKSQVYLHFDEFSQREHSLVTTEQINKIFSESQSPSVPCPTEFSKVTEHKLSAAFAFIPQPSVTIIRTSKIIS